MEATSAAGRQARGSLAAFSARALGALAYGGLLRPRVAPALAAPEEAAQQRHRAAERRHEEQQQEVERAVDASEQEERLEIIMIYEVDVPTSTI